MKCHFIGCTHPVAYMVERKFGSGGFFYTCEEHRPGKNSSFSITTGGVTKSWYTIFPLNHDGAPRPRFPSALRRRRGRAGRPRFD